MRIVSQIYGGLGNQLFQYARGKSLAIKTNSEFLIDVSFFETGEYIHEMLLDKFKIEIDGIYKPNIMDKLKIKLNKKKIIRLHNILSEDTKQNIEKHKNSTIYLDGYWQDEKYFNTIREHLVSNIVLLNQSEKYLSFEKKILECNSVAVHLRRGDYLYKEVKNHIGVCRLEYYIKAMEIINSKSENVVFYVFSDDIVWCKNNLKSKFKIEFISETFSSEESFSLMKNCKNQIISNSTFSWWAAWLNDNTKKIIIAPEIWWASNPKKSPVPDDWIKLKNT